MKTGTVKTVLKAARSTIDENSPAILTGIGCAGFVTSVIFAVRATPKALDLIEDAGHEAQGRPAIYPELSEAMKLLGPKQIVKVAWRPYIPAVGIGAASIFCVVAGQRMSAKRTAAIAGAYSIVEKTLSDYQEKVAEKLGERAGEIKGELAADKVSDDPVDEDQVISTMNGRHLVYDTLSGRYFRSDINSIREAVNDCNQMLIQEMYLDLNGFYISIGIPGVVIGSEIGWTVDRLIDIDYASTIATNGEPCIVLDYKTLPTSDFRRY